MPAVQICEGVYWVGVQDPDLRVFDIIMETKFGTSYGAYLVKGQDAAALIDTVKEEFCDEYLDNLRSVIDLSRIKYLLINHTEPDHSGSISKITELIPDLKIVGSGPALEFLREICHHSYNSQAIVKGMEIRLGGKTLRFLGAMYVGNGQVIEAFVDYGVHIRPIDHFRDYKEVCLLRVEAEPEIKEKAVEYAQSLQGKMFYALAFKPGERIWNCSKLIWRAYLEEGIDLDPSRDLWISPDIFYKSEQISIIRERGV